MLTKAQKLELEIKQIDDALAVVKGLTKAQRTTRIAYGAAAIAILALAIGLKIYLLIPLLVVLAIAFGFRQFVLGQAIAQALNGKTVLTLTSHKRTLSQQLHQEHLTTTMKWNH